MCSTNVEYLGASRLYKHKTVYKWTIESEVLTSDETIHTPEFSISSGDVYLILGIKNNASQDLCSACNRVWHDGGCGTTRSGHQQYCQRCGNHYYGVCSCQRFIITKTTIDLDLDLHNISCDYDIIWTQIRVSDGRDILIAEKSTHIKNVQNANQTHSLGTFNVESTKLGKSTLITCEFSIKSTIETKHILRIPIEENSSKILSKIMKHIYNEKGINEPDFSLDCNGKIIKVHRAILMEESPVWKAALELDMKEKISGLTHIVDVSYEVMAEIIRWFYFNKINEPFEIIEGLCYAADKYEIKSLKLFCENCILSEMNPYNAANLYALAKLYQFKRLEKDILVFIKQNIYKVIESPDFEACQDSQIVIEILSEVLNTQRVTSPETQ